MFQKGEFVMHKYYGVMRVEDTEFLEFNGIQEEYYVCNCLFGTNRNTLIKIPLKKTDALSPIMTKKEALIFVDELIKIKEEWIEESKKRIANYSNVFLNGNIHSLLSLLKGCYVHKNVKLTQKDREFMDQAEKLVFGELSISLDIPFEEVKKIVNNKMGGVW